MEALPIKGRPYRYRATIRWTERAAALPLCNCKGGHNSKEEALACKQAIKEMPTHLRPEEDRKVKGPVIDTVDHWNNQEEVSDEEKAVEKEL